MDTTGFGFPTGEGVDRDAPSRCGVLIIRRLLVLLGLALGCWLIGLVLHAGSAVAAPADPHQPAGLVGRVDRVAGTVAHVAHRATPRVALQVAENVASHTAPAADRLVRRTTAVVDRTVDHPLRTVDHLVCGTTRPVLRAVGRHAIDRVVGPVARTVTKAPATRHSHRRPAPHAARQVARTTVPTHSTSGTAADFQPGPTPSRPSSPVLRVAAPLPWSLDTVPSSPHSPQPLPISPAGSVATGGRSRRSAQCRCAPAPTAPASARTRGDASAGTRRNVRRATDVAASSIPLFRKAQP